MSGRAEIWQIEVTNQVFKGLWEPVQLAAKLKTILA
jgi:hypothetical protein